MTKIKTSELEGAALNWAVAMAAGYDDVRVDLDGHVIVVHEENDMCGLMESELYSPSTDWSQGGPLIEWYHVDVESCPWSAYYGRKTMHGDSPLIAACRAIVAAKLGDEVDVPEELT